MKWIGIMWLFLIALSCWHWCQIPLCFVCCVTGLRGTCWPRWALGPRTNSDRDDPAAAPATQACPAQTRPAAGHCAAPYNQNRETWCSLKPMGFSPNLLHEPNQSTNQLMWNESLWATLPKTGACGKNLAFHTKRLTLQRIQGAKWYFTLI